MKQMHDVELIKDFVENKNDKAFEVLVDRYTRVGLSFVYKILGDMSNAEDIVQDTFIKFYENAENFRTDGGSFKSWFFTVLHHASVDFLRKANRYDELDDEMSDNDGLDVVRSIVDKEKIEDLKEILNSLPIRQKEALILNYFEEYSQIKAAEIMKVSLKAYESLLYRAKKNLEIRIQGGNYEF